MSIDVEKILDDLGVDHYQAKDRFMVCCPFHNDSEPSCGLWVDTGYYKCFGCGEEGSFAEFIAKVDNVPIQQALRRLRGQTGVTDLMDSLGRMLDKQEEVFQFYNLKSFLKAFPAVEENSEAWDYLIGRGMTPESIKRFKMRWGGDTGKYRNRVVLPIFDPDGKLVAYVGRAIYAEMRPKTKKSRSPHRTFFGIYELLKICPKPKALVIVEGEFDAIYLQQFNIPAVSNMGTSPLTPWKINIIRKYAKKAVLGYDDDPAGLTAMYGVHNVPGKKNRDGELKKLSRYVPVVSARLIEGKDPNELDEQEVEEIFSLWRFQSV